MSLSRSDALAILTAPGEPYALTDTLINGRSYRTFANAPANLHDLFATAVDDSTFLVYAGERLSFRETYAKAAAFACYLQAQGIASGDRVAISLRNYPEWVIAFMAATSIGAIAVAMNALWQSDEMLYGLNDCGARVLIADEERLERLAPIRNQVQIAVVAVRPTRPHTDTVEFNAALSPYLGQSMPTVAVAPETSATIFYTSGSTGHPKGVLSTHRNVISALLSWELDAQAAALIAGLTPQPGPYQPATLMAVPLFHVTGSHAVFLSCYRQHRKLVCMYRWNPETAAELIESERITSVVAPAAMTGDLVRVARETQRDLSSLQVVGGGGAPRAPEQVRQIGATFASALPNTGWGMTETNAIGAGIGGLDYLAHPASSGRCSAVLELKVVDAAGNRLPAGERGELLVRGTSVFQGYWNRPELNATLFDDGWFRTGDVAYLDDEGYLYIVDRIKDLIIRGGENIGCGQVEAALVMHPDIIEAAVYAVPDERLGEEVGATVYAQAPIDEAALRDFLGAHLARFAIPRYLRFSDTPLPRTASGKILKRELRDDAVNALVNS
ncbi:MAG: class I adenylate-forming enzyme family protein [Pseudomonadales bacterium]